MLGVAERQPLGGCIFAGAGRAVPSVRPDMRLTQNLGVCTLPPSRSSCKGRRLGRSRLRYSNRWGNPATAHVFRRSGLRSPAVRGAPLSHTRPLAASIANWVGLLMGCARISPRAHSRQRAVRAKPHTRIHQNVVSEGSGTVEHVDVDTAEAGRSRVGRRRRNGAKAQRIAMAVRDNTELIRGA